MKFIRLVATTAMLFGLYTTAQAKTITAPFDDVDIYGLNTLSVTYNFDPAKQVLVCKRNRTTIMPSITYPLGHAHIQNYIPITLKNNPSFPGRTANPNGTLKIENTSLFTVSVSCNYITVL
jgi:hypothetical protein